MGCSKLLKIYLLRSSCDAESKAQAAPVRSENLILNVYFPPAEVVVKVETPGTILAGDSMEVSCAAGPSNPPAQLQWRYYHCSEVKLYMSRAEYSTIQLITAAGKRFFQQVRPDIVNSRKDCQMDEFKGMNQLPLLTWIFKQHHLLAAAQESQ